LESEALQTQTKGEKVYTVQELFDQVRSEIFAPTKKGKSLSILERMTQKNYVDALIIDVNKLFEKTNNKGLILEQTLQMPTLCSVSLNDNKVRNINYTVMKRVSEVTSYKKGELFAIRKLVNKKAKSGDAATQAHYVDLANRINQALGI